MSDKMSKMDVHSSVDYRHMLVSIFDQSDRGVGHENW